VNGLPLLWFSPPERGVLLFEDLHLSRSLRRVQRHAKFQFTLDRAFGQVIRACADKPRPGQDGTWITPGIVMAYVRLHRLGVAHSVEAWDGDRLVAGLYGVEIDGAFAAESMFYLEPNASKLTLVFLVEHLRRQGLDWLDIQVLTPHMERLGARAIPRESFLSRLRDTRARGLRLFRPQSVVRPSWTS
jgi:leucyl/phenylalanyl-tRNA--protein transferase